jgi:hypothetical protein
MPTCVSCRTLEHTGGGSFVLVNFDGGGDPLQANREGDQGFVGRRGVAVAYASWGVGDGLSDIFG